MEYFLELLKSNIVFLSILSQGYITESNLDGLDYKKWTNDGFELNSYHISEEDEFNTIMISNNKDGLYIVFVTNNPVYYENSWFYFGKQTYLINPSEIDTKFLTLRKRKRFYLTFEDKEIVIVISKYKPHEFLISLRVLGVKE